MTDTVDGVTGVSVSPTRAESLATVVRWMWRASRRTCDLYERLARRTSIPVLRRYYGWCGEEEHARGDELVALLAELDEAGFGGDGGDNGDGASGVTARCSPCTRRHDGFARLARERWGSDWPLLVAAAPEPVSDAAARGRRLAEAVVADGSARRAWAAEARRRLERIRANGVSDADELADHVRNAFG